MITTFVLFLYIGNPIAIAHPVEFKYKAECENAAMGFKARVKAAVPNIVFAHSCASRTR
jgi:hypothetical protein